MGKGKNSIIGDLKSSFKLESMLLEYPQESWTTDLSLQDLISKLRSKKLRELLLSFLGYIKSQHVDKSDILYVNTFDFSKTSLNMTYYLCGEERERSRKASRGEELLKLKAIYSKSGFEISDKELPDYLPLILEFAAEAPEENATLVLNEIKEPIETLWKELKEQGSPYAGILEAVNMSVQEFGKLCISAENAVRSDQ